MKNFPTWEESLNGITDSRIVGHPKINPKDVNLAKDGARIMYDRLYIILGASQPSIKADAEKAATKRSLGGYTCSECGTYLG